MSTTKVTQKGINALGDVIAGDKIVINEDLGDIGDLISKYRQEVEANATFTSTIEELSDFQTKQSASEEDLSSKMIDSGRDDMLGHALLTKEKYSKKMVRHQAYKSAQQVHVYLLGDTLNRFTHDVWPLIVAGKSREEIDSAVQKYIIDRVSAKLKNNTGFMYPLEITGMLYYLTGNCFIRWNKKDS